MDTAVLIRRFWGGAAKLHILFLVIFFLTSSSEDMNRKAE